MPLLVYISRSNSIIVSVGRIPDDIFEISTLKDFDLSRNNYPFVYCNEFINSNRFDTQERITFARELSFIEPELNDLEDIIRLSSELNIFPLPTREKPSNQSKNPSKSSHPSESLSLNSDLLNINYLQANYSESMDLFMYLIFVLNHKELVMYTTNRLKKTATNKNPLYQPGYIIKLIKQPFFILFRYLLHQNYYHNQENYLAPLILLKMYNVVVYAQSQDPSAEREYKDYEKALGQALKEIFSLSALDDDKQKFYKVLFPTRDHFLEDDRHESINGSKRFDLFDLLAPDSIISKCLEEDLKPVFSSPNIAVIVQEIFVTPSRTRSQQMSASNPDDKAAASSEGVSDSYQSKFERQITQICESFQNPRYCPVIIFYLSFFSNLFTIFLVYQTLVSYPPSAKANDSSEAIPASFLQYVLLFMNLSVVMYELGQLRDAHWVVSQYASTIWNKLNVCACLCLCWWSVNFIQGNIRVGSISILLLALSAVPQSLALLQYLCIFKGLGELVIMIFAM